MDRGDRPENRDALFRLGQLANDRGDRAQAAALAQRLRRRDPQRAQELEEAIRSSTGEGCGR